MHNEGHRTDQLKAVVGLVVLVGTPAGFAEDTVRMGSYVESIPGFTGLNELAEKLHSTVKALSGRKMLHKLLQVAESKQVDSIFLEVRESNDAAIHLYDKEGFNRLGIRKAYYPAKDGREDALVFAKALNLPDEQST